MGLDAWWTAAADVLVGAACHGCGRPGAGCCASCVASLAEPVRAVARPAVALPPTWASGAHEGPRRQLVVAAKDRGAWTLLPLLGDELARATAAAVIACGAGRVTLVPVPSSRAAVRRRGLDTTLALARHAARRLGSHGVVADVVPALAQHAGGRDQVGLGQAERLANLASRLVATRPVAGAAIVVDDIVTTGASLAAAAACLEAAGALVLGAATVSARGWT